MKKHYMMMGSLAVTAACLSMSALAGTEDAAAEAPAEATAVAVEAAEEAVGDSVDTAVQTVDEAAESVEEAVETVEGIGDELGVEVAHEESGEHADQAEHAEHTEYAEAHSPDAMAQWLANTQPGEHHGKLDGFVGQWDVNVQFWMAPGTPPQVNQGTSEIKWILGGRFIQEDFQSVMQMGEEPQIFQGFGLTGYDNIKQQYIGLWADTMSTTMTESTGQIDESTGALVMISEFDDPMTGQPTAMRVVFTQINEDEALMQAYKPLGDLDFKCLEITYTRKPL